MYGYCNVIVNQVLFEMKCTQIIIRVNATAVVRFFKVIGSILVKFVDDSSDYQRNVWTLGLPCAVRSGNYLFFIRGRCGWQLE